MTWSSISELAALALGSSPHETGVLENMSAGIRRVGTFRKMVSCREVEVNGRLELVFLREGEEAEGPLPYRRVVAGRAY
jgi:hypothetical protein